MTSLGEVSRARPVPTPLTVEASHGGRVGEWLRHSLGAETMSCRVLSLNSGSQITEITLHRNGEDARYVLRRILNQEWMQREPDLATREAVALRLAVLTPILTPQLIAYRVQDREIPQGLVLMSHVPGTCWNVQRRPPPAELEELAAALRSIHRTSHELLAGLPEYSPHHWHDRADLRPPAWSTEQRAWTAAIEAFRGWRSAVVPRAEVLLHRDFHLQNILWDARGLRSIVDWILACRGQPEADLGHCRWNLCRQFGYAAAEQFARAYSAERYQRVWDVLAAVGGMPDTVPTSFQEQHNLDEFIVRAVAES